MRSLAVRVPSGSFGAAEIVGFVRVRDIADGAARATVRNASQSTKLI